MSQNPWPLLLVGIGSFGFLAASMAQQTDPNDFVNEVPPASIQFPDFDDLDFNKGSGDSQSRWSSGDANTTTNTSPTPRVRFGGNIEEINKRPLATVDERALQETRRLGNDSRVRLRDTQPETAQIRDIQTGSKRRWDNLESATAPNRRRVAERNASSIDDNAEQKDGRPLFDTRETAILRDPPGAISANRSATPPRSADPGQSTPLATTNERQSPGTTTDTEPTIQDEAGREGDERAGFTFPLWSSMALFASVAANLFFCWIAWDAHSKYQDLVEDISESDTRMERQSRRLRNEPRRARRTRDADDSDFLRASVDG